VVTKPASSNRCRCSLAVDGAIVADRASSPIVHARPSISARHIVARLGSASTAATSANRIVSMRPA
jgi:hypothetical protein